MVVTVKGDDLLAVAAEVVLEVLSAVGLDDIGDGEEGLVDDLPVLIGELLEDDGADDLGLDAAERGVRWHRGSGRRRGTWRACPREEWASCPGRCRAHRRACAHRH